MNGLKLACLYSYKCERATNLKINDYLLGYLNNPNPGRKERNFIISLLKNLVSYYGYQGISELIGKRGGCFTERIVRAYWLGNKKLTFAHFNHNVSVLERFVVINADEHLSAQTATDILDCAVSFGEVLKVDQKRIKILNRRFLYKTGKIIFGEETREIDTGFPSALKKGDIVSVHRAIAREKISKFQARTLEDISFEALKIIQKA